MARKPTKPAAQDPVPADDGPLVAQPVDRNDPAVRAMVERMKALASA